MIVILDNIRSIHNVGSIFRTSDALAIEMVYLCGVTPGPLDRFGNPVSAFTKVSLGAEHTVPWKHCETTLDAIEDCRKQGFEIVAVEQHVTSVPYFSYHAPEGRGLALLFGNEVEGVGKEVLAAVDAIIEIPMVGQKESLNVSVAFGIVTFGLSYPRS